MCVCVCVCVKVNIGILCEYFSFLAYQRSVQLLYETLNTLIEALIESDGLGFDSLSFDIQALYHHPNYYCRIGPELCNSVNNSALSTSLSIFVIQLQPLITMNCFYFLFFLCSLCPKILFQLGMLQFLFCSSGGSSGSAYLNCPLDLLNTI